MTPQTDKTPKSLHSICRWTFNSGKGGFTPGNQRPAWNAETLDTPGMIRLVADKVAPRLPDNIQLGVELHYDNEINNDNLEEAVDAMGEGDISLAMITPGAHVHWAYGGIASLDPKERAAAEDFGKKTVDMAYILEDVWNVNESPTIVLWNGSWGYDLATVGVSQMYQNLFESVASLVAYEKEKGDKLTFGIEPKPNEGHPALLLPTVADAMVFARRLESYGTDVGPKKVGVNMELGHSQMIGLDTVSDVDTQLFSEDEDTFMPHIHLNSQGYEDGLTLGGPGKYDIDHGVKISCMNITIARTLQNASYARWKGHDMQVRPYDNERQGVDRVVRSVLCWEACNKAASELDTKLLMKHLTNRETGKAEDLMNDALVKAHGYFKEMYRK